MSKINSKDIIAKAVKMLKSNTEVTMRTLAVEVKCAPPSMYYHFEDKKDIVAKAMEFMVKESYKMGFVKYFRQYPAALLAFATESVFFDTPAQTAAAALIQAGYIDEEIRLGITRFESVGL